jgi:hypothetical protein
LELKRRVIVSPFHDDHDDDDDEQISRQRIVEQQTSILSNTKKPRAWSVRARRDVPDLLRGDR